MTTWYEDKWQSFECGCAVIRKCSIHHPQKTAELESALNVAREALVQIQNYYRGHPQQASIAEKALKEMGVPPAPPKPPEPRPFMKPG